MTAQTRRSEVELGRPVVAWLGAESWDVYQEVQLGGDRADLVAIRKPVLAVIELKTSLTFDLLAQATRWRGLAHHVFVAVPAARSSDGRRMAMRVFEEHGIGVLAVSDQAYGEPFGTSGIDARVKQMVAPTLNRRARSAELFDRLRPEHKTYAPAGSAKGGHFTEFRGTCDKLVRFVKDNPGALLKTAIDSIEHHYASPASAKTHLVKLIKKGVVKGVRVERHGRAVHLFPELAR